jgi:hypothetical protein
MAAMAELHLDYRIKGRMTPQVNQIQAIIEWIGQRLECHVNVYALRVYTLPETNI